MFVCSPAGLGAQFLNSVSYYILILKCPVPIDSGSYTLKAALFHTVPLWCCKQCNRQEDAWEWENLGISLLLKVLTAVFYKSEGAWQVKGEGKLRKVLYRPKCDIQHKVTVKNRRLFFFPTCHRKHALPAYKWSLCNHSNMNNYKISFRDVDYCL